MTAEGFRRDYTSEGNVPSALTWGKSSGDVGTVVPFSMSLVTMFLVASAPFLPGFGFVKLNVEKVFMIAGESSLVRMWSRELSMAMNAQT